MVAGFLRLVEVALERERTRRMVELYEVAS